MTDTKTILERYKTSFLTELMNHCIIYKTIGSSKNESPMWFQFNKILEFEILDSDAKNKYYLYFVSSQNSKIFFKIEIDYNHSCLEFDDFDFIYAYFRKLKYNYIKENHFTIYSELKN
jgi:hypothetical protein